MPNETKLNGWLRPGYTAKFCLLHSPKSPSAGSRTHAWAARGLGRRKHKYQRATRRSEDSLFSTFLYTQKFNTWYVLGCLSFPSNTEVHIVICEKTVATTVYACGDAVESDMSFSPCSDQDKPDHQVKINRLGSKRSSEKCGKYGCSNP